MTVEAGNGCPRKNIPSVERNEDQNVPSVIQGDISGVSIDKNMHYEHTRRMRARKYLRKGCCHRIKCSAANFLVALVWKRPQNSVALVTPTHRELVKVSDEISTQVMAWTTDK